MLLVYPDYYPRFRCAAVACRHTCCAGWEIDVDGKTAEKYAAVIGPMGDRLKEAVAAEPAPHFILGEGERCPFLNEGNLCDLILFGGEDMLCQICRDHPRHRSFLPGRTEVGVGLCCEAAAALILEGREPIRLLTEGTEEPEDGDAAGLIALRDRGLSICRDRSRPLERRIEAVLALCGGETPDVTVSELASFCLALERLDEDWTDILLRLRDRGGTADGPGFRRYMADRMYEYERLFWYFLYRHFLSAYEDGDPAGKACFAVVSVRLLFALGAVQWETRGAFSKDEQLDLARMYSAEIEYSEENLGAFFDAMEGGAWNG